MLTCWFSWSSLKISEIIFLVFITFITQNQHICQLGLCERNVRKCQSRAKMDNFSFSPPPSVSLCPLPDLLKLSIWIVSSPSGQRRRVIMREQILTKHRCSPSSERPSINSCFTSFSVTLFLQHYSSCSTVTCRWWPGKTLPLPVLVTQKQQAALLCAIIHLFSSNQIQPSEV